jgi:hypothetical protein
MGSHEGKLRIALTPQDRGRTLTSAGACISLPLSIRKRIGAQLKLDNQRA